MGDREISRQREEEFAIARRALPHIVSLLRQGKEPPMISTEISNEYGVDPLLSFKWAQIADEAFARKRRSVVARILPWMWLGSALAAFSGAAWIFGWIPATIGGIPLVAAGVVIGLAAALRAGSRAATASSRVTLADDDLA